MISGIHQIIGPTWEFTVGLSDPSTWNLSLGLRSDSAQILGGFSNPFHDWDNYNITLLSNNIDIRWNGYDYAQIIFSFCLTVFM